MADIAEDRLTQMAIDIQRISSTQTIMQWAGAVLIGIVIAVVGVNLTRVFTLGDDVGEVKSDVAVVANTITFVREDVTEIKADVKELRGETAAVKAGVDRISGALGVQPPAPQPQEPPKKN